mgnify:CR=1 FL=1
MVSRPGDWKVNDSQLSLHILLRELIIFFKSACQSMPVYGEDRENQASIQAPNSISSGFLEYLHGLSGLTKILLLAPIVLIAFIYSNHYRFMSRFEGQKIVSKEVDITVSHFMDTLTVAKSTGRIALATPVLQMQNERNSLKSIEATGCMLKVKEKYLQGMDKVINGFVIFMDSDNPDYQSTIQLVDGQAIINNAKSSVSSCTTYEKYAAYEKSGKM